MSEKSISIVIDHVFYNKHELATGYQTFFEDYDMAEPFRRLRSDKNIQPHDIILLKHERLEYELMKKTGRNYSDAHHLTETKYNYVVALKKYLKENNLE